MAKDKKTDDSSQSDDAAKVKEMVEGAGIPWSSKDDRSEQGDSKTER